MNVVPILLALLVLGVIGLVFGLVLTLADKLFKVETDPRVDQVREVLGGANCGACGYAGCDAFAEAVVRGEASPNGCPPGGAASAKAIGEIMGLTVDATAERNVARVVCQGTPDVAKERYEYDGYHSCAVAASLAGGPKLCRYACLGLGDCAEHCAFGAIKMENGIAVIDESLCTGCGACVKACPRDVISLLPESANVVVRCRNADSAKEARAACARACIACKRCVKECEFDAIHVENGFAKIDPEKCTRCGKCAEVCPCKCITLD